MTKTTLTDEAVKALLEEVVTDRAVGTEDYWWFSQVSDFYLDETFGEHDDQKAVDKRRILRIPALERALLDARAELARVKADAAAAVALVVGRAAEMADRVAGELKIRATEDDLPSGMRAYEDAEMGISVLVQSIRALATVDGLAEVQALRAERDDALARLEKLLPKLMSDSENVLEWSVERDTLAAEVARLKEQVAVLVGAVIWCSGSNDFQEGGVAREGWLKLCAPLIQPAADDDPPCTDCNDTGITHQTEQFCSCDAGRNALAQAQPVAEEGKAND